MKRNERIEVYEKAIFNEFKTPERLVIVTMF